jgi:hypothetical protein
VRTLSITLSIGIILGGLGVFGFFLVQGKRYASSRGEALAKTFANLPYCRQAEDFNDKEAMKARIVYNTATIPMLDDVIANADTRSDLHTIFSKERKRQEKELVLYTNLYKELYQGDSTPTKEELQVIPNNYIAITTNDQDAANTYLGILQGGLITLHREYYANALLQSKHARIQENAKQFILFKEELVKEIKKAKEIR